MTDNKTDKYLTVQRLKELLNTLQNDTRVQPNAVGNLLILSSDGNHTIGFIDFIWDGTVELWEEQI